VTGTIHRLVHGTMQTFLTQLWGTPGCQVLNTAYIERLNGTFRSCRAALGRRTRRSARRVATVVGGMYVGARSLTSVRHIRASPRIMGVGRPQRWRRVSPTMSGRSASFCTIGCRPRAENHPDGGGGDRRRFRR
jgi:hypothetical protein